jgi:hypothetical protein
LEVYSNEKKPEVYGVFEKNPNIEYKGSVPYTEVQKRMTESDVTVIVEGFAEKDIYWSRYSLSTKAADSLASGAAILTYGSPECGIVEYMQSTNASAVCTEKENLVGCIEDLFANKDMQEKYYNQQIVITEKNHNLKSSCAVFEGVVKKAMEK